MRKKCRVQSHGLPTDGIEERKFDKLIVLQILSTIHIFSLEYFCSYPFLDIWVKAEQMESTTECIGGGISASRRQCPPSQKGFGKSVMGK